MRKEYTINELASILGCSRTAVVKKIKQDENNPDIRRYKGRYDVGVTNGQITILMDDADLEHEKKLSKGFNTGNNNTVTNAQSDDVIDVEPEKETNTNNLYMEFTNRYIEQFTTFQKDMYNELKQRDNQILLLTTSEKTKEQEYLRAQAENKSLRLRNRVLTVLTGIIITVLLIWITVFVTINTIQSNDTSNSDVTVTQEIQKKEPVKKPTR